MGMDLTFVAISKDRNQLEELKKYIDELYDRDFEDDYDRRMLGYGMTICECAGYVLLCGCHRKCFGYDLGYWCKRENKNKLLEGIIYLEERQEDSVVYKYYPGDELSEEGLLSFGEELMDYHSQQFVNDNHDFPVELVSPVCSYFRTGDSSVIT